MRRISAKKVRFDKRHSLPSMREAVSFGISEGKNDNSALLEEFLSNRECVGIINVNILHGEQSGELIHRLEDIKNLLVNTVL